MNIGEKIKIRRKELRLTQQELGEKVQISQKQISKYEKNESQPPIDQLEKIAEVLNMKIEINGTANKPPERKFSKQQQELIEIMEKMTDQEQTELIGAVKMYIRTK